MKKFALLTNYTKDRDLHYTHIVEEYIAEKGGVCWVKPEDGHSVNAAYDDLHSMPEDIECALALGGDGTLLRAAREMFGKKIPVLGINIGTLGFLTSAEKSELPICLDSLMAGEYVVEERMMLKTSVYQGNVPVMQDIALNDVVISRSGFSRLVELKIYVNNQLLNIYNADGMIISTPTGSTGYNLSAGGPVVFPLTDVIIITPICPHSLGARSLVVSGSDCIRVEIGRRQKTQKEEAIITCDGQTAMELKSGDKIEICRAEETTGLIQLKEKNFYQILQSKMGNV